MSDFCGASKPALRLYQQTTESVTSGLTEPGTDRVRLAAGRTNGRKDAQIADHPRESIPSDRQQRELDRIAGVATPKRVDVAVGQIVPLLIDAAESDRSWLKDFADDSVRIDADLYEVLLAYKRFRERDAA